MKILVVTKHLAEYAGSELFTRDMCLELSRRGHRVSCYAWEPGAVSRELSGRGVEVVSDLREIIGRHFDVIHAQHGITALLARAAFPSVPMAYFVHGIVSAFERLPALDLRVSAYGGVSEEVARDTAMRYGIPVGAVRIIRNPVDTDRFRCERPISRIPRNLLILSNHLTEEVRRTIETACDRADIAVSHVGLPENPQRDVERFMCRADIVVTLGRGAVEAMACGRNVIVYDRNGGDGFVDLATFPVFRERNFSGRTGGKRFTAAEFGRELANYDAALGDSLRSLVLEDHSVAAMGESLEALYREAMSGASLTREGELRRILLRFPFALWYVHGLYFLNRMRKIRRLLFGVTRV